MNYYNWKTGQWETRTQCSETPMWVASQSPVCLDNPKASRIKQLFVGYMRFENKLYGQMLGKGHHLVTAAMMRWLLRAVIAMAFFGLLYAVYALVMFVFKIIMFALAAMIVIGLFTLFTVRRVYII